MASTLRTLTPDLQARRKVAGMATIATAGAAYFALAVAALHFVRPDLNPLSKPTSAYAVGPNSFIMTSAFFGMSAAAFALAVALYQGLPQAARSRTGIGLLALWGVGVLIAMIFPMDAEGAPETVSGTIHQIAGPLTFLSATAGMALVSWRFKQDGRWRSFYPVALALSLVMLAVFIATFLSFITGSGLLGLAQRIALAAVVTWWLLTAARLRSAERGPDAAR